MPSECGGTPHGVSLRPVVRLATFDDAADVARLLCEFRDWHGRDEPGDASIRASVDRLLADPDTEYLLAGDPPSGVLQLRFRHAVWTGTDDAHLEDLFVSEDARGSGIGRELVEAAFGRARARGAARMLLDTAESNEAALRLYRSMGFRSGSDETGGRELFMRLRL
jgi:ribosomal protein S18 acetylase RimI-like enzyme